MKESNSTSQRVYCGTRRTSNLQCTYLINVFRKAFIPMPGKIMYHPCIAKWEVEDILIHVDKKQFGNVKGCSTVHYLVYLLNLFLKALINLAITPI